MKNNNVPPSFLLLATTVSLAFAAVPASAQKPRAAVVQQGPGYKAADAAYKAYDKRDYAAAVALAQEATRLAPANKAYWLLLVNSLIAANRLADAEQALDRGIQLAGDGGDLARAREPLRRAQAQAAGTAMYRALEAGNVPAATGFARSAVGYAPEHPGYRLILVHALLRGDQFIEAEKVAGETVALLPDSAVPLALRAYARQRLGRWPDAQADMDRALQQRGLTPVAQRQLRLIAADAALAAGDAQRVAQVLQALPQEDAEAQQRRQAARWLQPAALQPLSTAAFPPPAIDCANVDSAQTCTVLAGAAPRDPAYELAAAAYKAMDARDHALAMDRARQASAAAPANRDYQLLYLNAAQAAGNLQEAEQAATAALALDAADAAVLAQRASIRRRMGNAAGAAEDANAALRLGKLPDVEQAYLANSVGDHQGARAAFGRADAAGKLPETALQDAAYASLRAHRDQEAIDYFKRTVDAADSLKLKLDPQMLFDTRRAISEVSRKFGVLASLTYRTSPGTNPNVGAVAGVPGNKTLQAGAEAYWRPWGFRNGKFVELFVRGFETLYNENGGVTGGDSFQGALGVRWKPLTQHNAVLSLSRVFGSNSASDWLAQAAYSLDHGTDLRVDVASWWTSRFSAEVGRFTEAPQTYGLASWQLGRSYRLSGDGKTVIFPHGVLAAEYNSTFAEKSSVGLGPGVSVRHWFREDKYHAPRSYVDLTMQYRARISGDDRIKGVYVNTLLSY